MIEKKCGTCGEAKPLSRFYKSKTGKHGYGSRCKPCDNTARQRTRDNSPATKEGYRRRSLMIKYGLTLEDYDAMLLSQNGRCAICGTDNPLGEGNVATRDFSFAVDHCHHSGKVRGLLCNPCNRGIGFLQDSVEILKKAADYLECH